jgi:Kelch motif
VKRREFIALLGGVLLAGSGLLIIASFAQGIGRWIISTPMPSSRTEVAVAEVGGKIYVVGGFGGERELEIYDSAADRWSRGASIPRALHHAAAVGLKDKLYVVGGFVEGWTPTDEVHEYGPASDRWKRLAALPTPRGALAAVAGIEEFEVAQATYRAAVKAKAESRHHPAPGRSCVAPCARTMWLRTRTGMIFALRTELTSVIWAGL